MQSKIEDAADLTCWLMKKNARAAHKPRLYVSCGTRDFLYSAYE